jgi:hypothetical protein
MWILPDKERETVNRISVVQNKISPTESLLKAPHEAKYALSGAARTDDTLKNEWHEVDSLEYEFHPSTFGCGFKQMQEAWHLAIDKFSPLLARHSHSLDIADPWGDLSSSPEVMKFNYFLLCNLSCLSDCCYTFTTILKAVGASF